MPDRAEFEAVFADPRAILEGMSPALKKRMQGKACFNFTKRDSELLSELSRVTHKGYEAWRKIGCVE